MMERTYRVNDIVSEEFLRLPLSLLANPKYKQMSLEAKFVYSLLLNRMTLSQRNRWFNDENEVYLIYTREEAANTLNISYKKSIAAFKELIEVGLLFEQRQGRGYPNLLYVLKAELTVEDATEFSDEFNQTEDENGEKEPENPVFMQTCQNGTSRHAEMAYQELPKSHIKTCQNGTSRTAVSTGQDMPKSHPSKINNKKTENSYIENSQSVNQSYGNFSGIGVPKMTDGLTDDEEKIQEILDRCELHLFKGSVRQMLIQAVERLYYSESLKIGNARLPQAKVRSYLNLLDCETLMSTVESMKVNEDRIINPMAYIMSTIINAVCEKESDLILSLPAQYVSPEDLYAMDDYSEEGDEDDDDLYTADQQMILDLVNRFGAIREDQAKGILKHMYPGAVYEKTVFPLVTGRKIKQSNGYLFSKSGKLDEKIITAIDIMLILGFELKEPIIKGTEPFALTFFRKREEKLWRYDICPVSYGTEAAVSALLENINVKYRMLIFVPEKEEQMQGIRVPCDHCYVIKNDGNYEFYLYSKEGEE